MKRTGLIQAREVSYFASPRNKNTPRLEFWLVQGALAIPPRTSQSALFPRTIAQRSALPERPRITATNGVRFLTPSAKSSVGWGS